MASVQKITSSALIVDDSSSLSRLVSNASLAIASGYTSRVDVLQITSKDYVKYGLVRLFVSIN